MKLILKFFANSSVLLIFTALCAIASEASAAEKLTLKAGVLQQSLTVKDLEKFVETGVLSPELQNYAMVLTPQTRQALKRSFYIDAAVANKFFNQLFESPDGQLLIEQLTQALPESNPEDLQAALTSAVEKTNRLNVLNFLQAYPEDSLTVDLTSALSLAVQLNASFLENKAIAPILENDLKVNTDNAILPSLDPAEPGAEAVSKMTIVVEDKNRQRRIPLDIYYSLNPRGPLIVMSHGFAADRRFLSYLARHLASHGFTVVALEHPGSNVHSLTKNGKGLDLNQLLPASEFIDRPQDISFVLDQLEKINQQKGYLKGKFNTQQVTVIGHSFGGYTALALAGGELNPKELRNYCQTLPPLGRSPADWLQCAAANLPQAKIQLKDSRVAQVVAFNPIVGNLFGDSLKQVDIPTLIFSSSEDAITPTIPNQLQPFQQLSGEKYLITAINATHLSITDIGNLNGPMVGNTLVKEVLGKDAKPVRQLARGVTLAFISQLTPQKKDYQPFLTPAFVQSLSSDDISLRFSTQLPITVNEWIKVLRFSNQQIVLRPTKKEAIRNTNPVVSFFEQIKKYIMSARNILPQPESCSGQLEEIFTSLLENYQQGSVDVPITSDSFHAEIVDSKKKLN